MHAANKHGGYGTLHPVHRMSVGEQESVQKVKSEQARARWRKHLLVVSAMVKVRKGISPRAMAIEAQMEHRPSFLGASWCLLTGSWLNVLLLVAPLALCAPFIGFSDALIFALTCLSILPLASLLGDATEQVAMHTNEIVGGLLNATFGNATELIVAIFALRKGLVTVVQTSLLGSILSNVLLVFGCACLVGGLCWNVVSFNVPAATSNVSMLLLAVLGVSVPTMLKEIGQGGLEVDLHVSRVIAIIMLASYCLYVYFQLHCQSPSDAHDKHVVELKQDGSMQPVEPEDDDEDSEEAIFSLAGAVFWLCIVTVAIAVLSEFMTDAIEGAAHAWGLPDTFIGFVILPIVGNAAEHATAIVMAKKGKMNLALAVALGSSTQIALFVIPFMVMMGIPMSQPMDLQFGAFEMLLCFISVLICGFCVQDGQSNWLEGSLLLAAYCIIATSFFFYKEPVNPNHN